MNNISVPYGTWIVSYVSNFLFLNENTRANEGPELIIIL